MTLKVRPRFLLRVALLVIGLDSMLLPEPTFGDAQHSDFRHAQAGYHYAFPRDHGSHDAFRTEWWYYTGHLATEDGRRFGYQLTFFRRAMAPDRVESNPSRWAIRHLYLAHVALSDVNNQRFHFDEKVSRAGLGKAGAEAGGLRVWIDRWAAESSRSEQGGHHLHAASDQFSLDLAVVPEKSPVVHGVEGRSLKGKAPGQASHYYSFTRLSTSGVLTIDGKRLAVSGMSWMDHEFGSGDLGDDQVGWDWFSIQLGDGLDLMLYRLRRGDGTIDPVSSGTLVMPNGQARHLMLTDVQVDTLDHWKSPVTGALYPSRWRVMVPCINLRIDVTPLVHDQELRTHRSTQVTYWEGAVQITGTWAQTAVTGQGYVELTGYAESFRP